MQFNLTVCPDFKPDLISGWFFFNTWFQKQINQGVHLEIYQTFAEQDKAIEDKRVDIIYANPCDVARLVRDEGFIPIAKPKEKPDEAIIASLKEGSIHGFDDIPEQVRIAHTSARDVNTIGMIMLEPADLEAENIEYKPYENYTIVAKSLLKGDADIGFFLAEAFNEFSGLIQKQLNPIISSKIHLIHHALLIGPRLADHEAEIRSIICNMHQDEKGSQILRDLEITEFESMDQEQAEFMIDLTDTLVK